MFEMERNFYRPAHATAVLQGSGEYPGIKGAVCFYQTGQGVLVTAEVTGLPIGGDSCDTPIFAFHIHEGGRCTGNAADPFADVRTHYNPDECAHPYHAGDLPPLFGNNGYAFMAVLTDRFTVSEILGRTVVIHRDPDDFHTQPAGNAGVKIACGEIRGRSLHKVDKPVQP